MTATTAARTVRVDDAELEARASALRRTAGTVLEAVPQLLTTAVGSGVELLPAYGILDGLAVLEDVARCCSPVGDHSLPAVAGRLELLAAEVVAAAALYRCVDAAQAAAVAVAGYMGRAGTAVLTQLPTLESLALLSLWDTESVLPPSLRPCVDVLLDVGDDIVEGRVVLAEVDAATLRDRGVPVDDVTTPVAGLPDMLRMVAALSSPAQPSTIAVIHVGDDPPRFVVCIPGLQNDRGNDSGSADLPGAVATLTGHSAYVRGVGSVLRGLPPGSQVLLVGHSQGGMVAQALAADPSLRRNGVRVAGVLTAGSPRLATDPPGETPFIALESSGDPVPRLRQVADVLRMPGLPALPVVDRHTVRFRAPRRGLALANHGLDTGGYLAVAGSERAAVASFRSRVAAFFTDRPVTVRYVAVSDSDASVASTW